MDARNNVFVRDRRFQGQRDSGSVEGKPIFIQSWIGVRSYKRFPRFLCHQISSCGSVPWGENAAEVIFMAQTTATGAEGVFADRTDGQTFSKASSPAYQILRVAFVVAPVVAGPDKFVHLPVNWDMYLAPVIANLSPIGGHRLMLVIGIVEIIAGIIVAVRPRIGAYVVCAWLLGIVINLLLIHGVFDIALRDFGLALGRLRGRKIGRQEQQVFRDVEQFEMNRVAAVPGRDRQSRVRLGVRDSTGQRKECQ